MKICGIYKITSPSGRVYIGQSIDIYSRWKYSYKGHHAKQQTRLYASFLKYGYENHKFEIVEECIVEMLNERERYWQEYYNVLDQKKGLNCRYTKTNDKSGKLSEHTIKAMSKSFTGRKASEETKLKMRLQRKGGGNSRALLVLNTETGIYYDCVKDAAFSICLKRKSLANKLNNIERNKTMFRLVSKDSNEIIEDKSTHIRYDSKGSNNHWAKTVLNLETGIYYGCIKDASDSLGVKRNTLRDWLIGKYKNKSSMIYV